MIKEKILKHKTAVILALVLSFLMIWPQLHFMVSSGKDFRGIVPSFVDDEDFYNARVKDVIDGHPMIGNAYLFEHKNSLSIQFLGEYLLAQPLKFFGLSVIQGRFLYNLLLPSLSFLLTYLIFYLISKSRRWSAIFSSFLFFGLYLGNFLRPVSPQLNFIFWLTQFIFLWRLVKEVSSRKFLLLNIVNLGLLFYIYPYYWTFYVVFLAILAGIYFIYDRGLSLAMVKVISGGFVIGIPYFINSYSFSQAPEYAETITRVGLIFSRFPSGIWIISWAFVLAALFALALKRKLINFNDKTALLFIGGILAAVISSNSNIITGKNLEFSSHYRMLSVFFFSFSFAYLWKLYLERNFRYKKIAGMVLLSVALLLSAQNTYAYLKQHSVSASPGDQDYALLFNWLNKNMPKDSVIYANDTLSNLIPIYTSNNVFYSENANLFLAGDSEIITRFVLNNYFETFNREFVIKNARSIYRVRYIDKYGKAVQSNKLRKLLGIKTVPEVFLPEDAINNVLNRAVKLQKEDLEKELKNFRVDYVLWDKDKNPEWKFGNKKFVSKIFEHNSLVLYSVANNPNFH